MKTHRLPRILTLLAIPVVSAALLHAEPPMPPGDAPCPPPHGGGPGGPQGFRGGPPDKGPHGMLEMLQLTEEQKAKVKEIFEANKPKMDAARDEAEAKRQETMAAIDSQIRPLLTKEQQVVFDDLANLRKAEEALRKDSAALKKQN